MGRLGRPLVASVLFLATVVHGRAQVCNLTQISNASGAGDVSFLPAIDAAGDRIAFVSNADLVGANGDGGFEVFLWDASTGLTQITNVNSTTSLVPAINAAGTRIAFESNANPLGTNVDGNYEIFLWDASTGLAQITNTLGGNSLNPSINADGNRIAFDSNAIIGSNGDGNNEIFLWDSSTGFTQITDTVGGKASFSPAINADGTRIAFQSEADLLGTNADGDFEIFLWDASTGLAQITNTSITKINFAAAINAAGNRIAFASNADPVGGNGDGNSELFLWDSSTGLTQITNTANVESFFSPAINAAGNRIVFETNADLLGNGTGSYEVFLWDTSSGFTQITNSNVSSFSGAIDAAGTRVAFGSSANFLGSNSDGNDEVFLASCDAVAAVPTVSPLGLGALTLLLGLAAVWMLRRRAAAIR
jgi:Tol biopolymer transport system component